MPLERRLVAAALALILVAVACRESATDPRELDPAQPNFFASGPYGSCRVWYNGVAEKWIASSTWSGPCPVTVTVTSPRSWLGSTNPDSVVYVFGSPVGDIAFGLVYSCPTLCPTTQMSASAYGADGVTKIVDHRPFTGSPNGTGGQDYLIELRGLPPIKRLVIHAPVPLPPDQTGDRAISWLFDIGLLCPGTGDPDLDDPTNKEKMDSTFQASNPDAPQSERRERLRAGYRYPDGHVESIDITPPNATSCGISDLFIPLGTTDGGVLDWLMHPHPFTPGEQVTECGGVTFAKPKTYVAGPSNQSNAAQGKGDWDLFDSVNNALRGQGSPPVRMYVFDKQNVYTMLPNPVGQSPTDTYTTIDRAIASCGL